MTLVSIISERNVRMIIKGRWRGRWKNCSNGKVEKDEVTMVEKMIK